MSKMYLQHDNGGYGLLVTDERDDEHHIKAYTGLMNIDAVSAYENNGRDFDLTEYIEV